MKMPIQAQIILLDEKAKRVKTIQAQRKYISETDAQRLMRKSKKYARENGVANGVGAREFCAYANPIMKNDHNLINPYDWYKFGDKQAKDKTILERIYEIENALRAMK